MREITHLLTIAFIALVVLSFVWQWWMRRGARKMLDQQKAIYSGTLEYADASPHDFPWVDTFFYDDVSARMAQAGFRYVGDIQCVTANKQYPSMRTFLRCFIGGGGTTMAAAYHVKMRGALRLLALLRVVAKDIRAVEFESEFTDHTFLTTSNLAGLNPFTSYAGITTHQHPPGTPLEELLADHREAVRDIVAQREVTPVRVSTKKEMLASQDRMHVLKSSHAKSHGYVSRDQFEAIAGRKLSKGQRRFVETFEALRDEQDQ
ncbi:MAG: hypothetical protein JXQ73_27160 [Phycisphaerae bacterium]|nr:hypothetical protein [Phycisphaerae bacterium]